MRDEEHTVFDGWFEANHDARDTKCATCETMNARHWCDDGHVGPFCDVCAAGLREARQRDRLRTTLQVARDALDDAIRGRDALLAEVADLLAICDSRLEEIRHLKQQLAERQPRPERG